MKILYVGLALILFFAAAGTARAADPVAVEIHYQNGVKYFKRGLYDKSIQELEKTLEMDPKNEEAQAYLDKVRALQKTYRPAEARASTDATIKDLYVQGKRLYRQKEYEKAIDVFSQVLSLKPIDDFASYYREKSEMMLSRKLAREKKIKEQRRLREEARTRKSAPRVVKKETSPPAPAVEEKASAPKTAAVDAEKPLSARELKRQIKIRAAELSRQEKLRAKEEKRARVQRRREEKRQAAEERRQERLAQKTGAQEAGTQALAASGEERDQVAASGRGKREERRNLLEQRRENKKRFLEGVTSYGRKDYRAAITAFRDVIKAETKTGALYTRSATRLIDKSQKRLAGLGEDAKI